MTRVKAGAGEAIRFHLDATPDFPGFAHGSTWNGFDDVYVTPEVRDVIVAYLREDARAMGVTDPVRVEEWVSGIDELPVEDYGGVEGVSLGGGFVGIISGPPEPPVNGCPVLASDEHFSLIHHPAGWMLYREARVGTYQTLKGALRAWLRLMPAEE